MYTGDKFEEMDYVFSAKMRDLFVEGCIKHFGVTPVIRIGERHEFKWNKPIPPKGHFADYQVEDGGLYLNVVLDKSPKFVATVSDTAINHEIAHWVTILDGIPMFECPQMQFGICLDNFAHHYFVNDKQVSIGDDPTMIYDHRCQLVMEEKGIVEQNLSLPRRQSLAFYYADNIVRASAETCVTFKDFLNEVLPETYTMATAILTDTETTNMLNVVASVAFRRKYFLAWGKMMCNPANITEAIRTDISIGRKA